MDIDYTHENPTPQKARLVRIGLSLGGLVRELIENLNKGAFPSNPAPVPVILKEAFPVSTRRLDGHKVWTIAPAGGKPESLVVYLHGGAYVENILPFHWLLLQELAERTRSLLIVPDYPLAPTSGWQDTHAFMDHLFARVKHDFPTLRLIYMGDSAGGGLALAHAMKLRDDGKKGPEELVVISPWLDIGMSNPDIDPIESRDKMLDRQGLLVAASHYAKGTDLRHPLLSPLHGDFSGLGRIALFIGTNDLLYPDCVLLKQKLRKQGHPIDFYEYPEMFHVWVAATKLSESQHAIAQMVQYLIKQ